ncbi:MAG: hypothetical protein OXU45_00430 [Candidatus Melainabacteria bacterium]|nr:hypothetical protein [Candidatus Melainabacteria bacterium]
MTKTLLSLVLSLACFSLPVSAASILAACNDGSSPDQCSVNDIYFPTFAKVGSTYDVDYRVDLGGLGDIEEDTAFTSTQDMLELWEAESSLNFIHSARLSEDIDNTNYEPILDPSTALGYSPIVFDDDGKITNALFGQGSKNSVLGFAGAVFYNFVGNDITSIAEGQAVFNGHLYSQAGGGGSLETILVSFKTTILHEFGHMFGLDHTQGGNLEGYNNNDSDLTDVPVMFPFEANPLIELQHDDIASVRDVYPVGNESSSFGTITGTLTEDGSRVRGANVVAYLVDDSNPRKRAVASPSDVAGAGDGAFRLPILVPGSYILRAEAIDSNFTGGSSVGIYDPISTSRITEGFYNGDNQPILESTLTNALSQAEQITVTAGSSASISFNLSATGEDDGDDGGSGGGDDNGSTAEASFTLTGQITKKAIRLKNFKQRNAKLTVRNLNPGTSITVKVSTDYPDLITFPKGDTQTFSKRKKKFVFRLASYFDFLEEFPGLSTDGSVEIPITVEDQTSGYTDDNETLLLF